MLVWRGRPRPRMLSMRMMVMVTVLMIVMGVFAGMGMIVLVGSSARGRALHTVHILHTIHIPVVLPGPVFLAGHVFFAVNPDVNFRGGDPAAHDFRDFQSCADTQGRYGLLEQFRRNPSVDQGAEEHVAADPGEAFEVGNPHREVDGRRSSVVGLTQASDRGPTTDG